MAYSKHITLIWLTFAVISLTVWLIWTNRADSVSTLRWTICFITPILISLYGLIKKSLDVSGSQLAFVVGVILSLASGSFFAIMIAFFISSSRLTKWKKAEKSKFEELSDTGTARNWKQVFCNGGVAVIASLLYLYSSGVGEQPLVISSMSIHLPTLYALACLGAIACCCGDTWASEVGSVLSHSPRLITTLRPVPRGTNGGVSLPGLIASALGGLMIGLIFYIAQRILILDESFSIGAQLTPQWIVIPLGTSAGLLGSAVDSVLGATLQYSGYCSDTGRITHSPNTENTKHIAGRNILSNNNVNLISSFIMAVVIPCIALLLS